MAELFIRTRGSLYGPYSEADLRAQLKSGNVPFSAWVFREGSWRLLGEIAELRDAHPEFEERPTEAPQAGKASARGPVAKAIPPASVSTEPVWFYALNRKRYGPFSSAELVGQLQRKELGSGTFVWKP